MDALATNAETLNDEWRAKELVRPLGSSFGFFDEEAAEAYFKERAEEARAHALRDVAKMIFVARGMRWVYFFFLFCVVAPFRLDVWAPDALVDALDFCIFLFLLCVPYAIIYDDVSKRFDGTAARVILTLVAGIAADVTFEFSLPAVIGGISLPAHIIFSAVLYGLVST